ncbi:hypothetical protein SEA_LUNA18_1 [Microbacterium phage Luna18]|nr:hypothetical protein SEA_KATCHAN_1 [Microbacterium phage KatChan]URQ04852.1 hypothetical protein SEA_LUNA18_1 [Microbacterium phage Luna18]
MAMPPRQQRAQKSNPATQSGAKRCQATTTAGQPCRKVAVPGLTVCKSHGGGTTASLRASKRASVSQQAAVLWGISSETGGLSVQAELEKLARNKLTDIIALRLKISGDDVRKHIGMLTETHTITEYDIQGTVQSKEGTQEARSKRSGTSVWVQELHKTEMEYVTILKLLQEVSGGQDDGDVRRIRIQTAKQAARLAKAFPGLSADDIAAEVNKKAS